MIVEKLAFVVIFGFVWAIVDASSSSASSAWAELQISPNEICSEICSMPYGNFRVKIYEHLDNHKSTTNPSRKQFFYAPIALLDPKSAISEFNDITQQMELRFRVDLWNDKVENDVVKYLNELVGQVVKRNQVQVIPFQKVALTSTVGLPSTIYSLPSNWMSFNLQRSLWFSLSCFEPDDCFQLAVTMKTNPEQFQNLQLLFSLSSQPSETKEITFRLENIITPGQMVSTLMRRFENAEEVILTEKDEKKLLTEIRESVIGEMFGKSDVLVSTNSRLKIYNTLKELLVFSKLILTKRDANWGLVFWDDDSYRPDKTSQILNDIYENQNEENKGKLSDAYIDASSSSRDAESISQLLTRSAESTKNQPRSDFTYRKEYLEKLYNKSRGYVEWDGEKFVPKPLSCSKIYLGFMGDDGQLRKDRRISVRYSTAFLSTPFNVAEEADFLAIEECQNAQADIVTLKKELNETRSAFTETKKQLNETSQSYFETKSIIENLTKKLKETEDDLKRKNLVAESIDNLTKELLETKSAVIQSKQQLIEGKATSEHLAMHLKEMDKVIGSLKKELNETQSIAVESKISLNNTTSAVLKLKKRVKYRQVLRQDIKEALQKKLFDLMTQNNTSLEAIESLIEDGVDINSVNQEGLTPLLQLTKESNEKDNVVGIILLFIDHGVDVNAKDKMDWNVLQLLCQNYQKSNLIDIIRLLIENGVDIKTKTKNEMTALHLLCWHYKNDNLIDIIRLLIQRNVDINLKGKDGNTPLHLLCRHNQSKNLIDIIRLLIQRNVDMKLKDKDGHTPLHLLYQFYTNENLIEITRLLIENGVEIKATNNNGWNTLHLLCRYYQNRNLVDIVRLLIQNGVDAQAKLYNEWTVLHLLFRHYQNGNLVDIVQLLIQNGVDVKGKLNDGWTALHLVCRYYQNENLIDIVGLLIQNGVDVKAITKDEWTALHLVCRNYQNENLIDIVGLLIQNGFDVKAKTKDEWTALHLVCRYYQNENLIDIVGLLIQNGVDVKAKTKDEWTTLNLVCRNYQNENLIDIVRLLIQNGVDVKAKNNAGENALTILGSNYKKGNVNEVIKLLS